MINYTKLESVYNYIPSTLLEDWGKHKILSVALQGLRELSTTQQYVNMIKLLAIENNSVALPEGLKDINEVYYLHTLNKVDADTVCEDDSCTYRNDGTACSCDECDPSSDSYKVCPTSTIYDRKVCSYRPCINCTLNYDLFWQSSYTDCIVPMKYIGNSSTRLCKECNRNLSPYTYTVDTDLTFRTNLEEGYVCIDYKCEPKDSKGSYLVPNSTVLFKYLSKYILMNYFENKIIPGEANSIRLYEMYKRDTELLYNRAKGKYIQRSTSKSKVFKSIFSDIDTFANKNVFR